MKVALVLVAAWLAVARAEPLPSGTQFLGDALRVQQRDPAANPGMLWVSDGEALWARAAGRKQASCASCHGEAETSMSGVATRYPAFDADANRLLNLEGRINRCRHEHQGVEALTAFVARQSLGMPMQVATDGPAQPFYQAGRDLFHRRQGQLNLSCSQCHDDHAGRRLRGDTISYGLGNGYPAYRLEWQSLGSLHRRLRACSFGVRAVQLDYGAAEYLSLELYLAKRAEGVAIETPAIRR
jgi:sulfur-oxidizing protein SoxA